MAIFLKQAYTFDDVLLLPNKSDVLPKEALLSTQLTKKIKLNIPIVSASMDTVTEAKMAIAIAKLGGIGIIHKNCSISEQVDQVLQVKQYFTGIVSVPFFIFVDDDISSVRSLLEEKFNRFILFASVLPVVDENKKIVGIITKDDLFNESNKLLKINKIMQNYSNLLLTKEELEKKFHDLNWIDSIFAKTSFNCIIVDQNCIPTALLMPQICKLKRDFPNIVFDCSFQLPCGASIGIGGNSDQRLDALVRAGVDVIVIDTAHGHSTYVIEMVKRIKAKYPDLQIIAGNVATGEATQDLIDAGADAVKVGVGPGSICTTRIISGIGVPQFSAILDCVAIAKGNNIPIIADGGIKQSGDIVKALAAGASTVMLGSLLAGCEESPGEIYEVHGKRYKKYRGMGSLGAMLKGSSDRYFQDRNKKLVPEGVEGSVQYKGKLCEVVFNLTGGIRQGMGYLGARTIDDICQKAKFVVQTSAGLAESHPHDLALFDDAPNYHLKGN